MKLTVKNKFLSLAGGSKVLDETGAEKFKVKGKIFSIRRKKKICSLDGKLFFVVKNKFFNWWTHTSYILDADKKLVASVKNRGFKGGYDVVSSTDEISIDGWGMTGYTVYKNGKQVGTVKPKIMSMTDTYEVNIDDTEDPAFVVAVVIAIDNISDKASKSR